MKTRNATVYKAQDIKDRVTSIAFLLTEATKMDQTRLAMLR